MLRLRVEVLIVLMLLADRSLLASSICASVTMSDDSPLPKSEIRIVSLLDPSIHFSAITGSDGKACVSHLPEGVYSVEAGRGGFVNSKYYPIRVVFPNDISLSFRLPLGEVREGLGLTESTLSGTLLDNGKPADGVKLCLLNQTTGAQVGCTVTNDLGQYALVVPPGTYEIELARLRQRIDRSTIDLSSPGYYHNKVTIPLKR